MTEHNNENFEMDNTITLVDENGGEIEFEIIDMIEVDEEEYAILLPKTNDGVGEEAIILKVGIDDEGEEMLYEIESDDEWEMVANIWQENLEEDDDVQ
ncbi:MAG: hypothetical protein APF76_08165 [Desulfitibacter sp. BRH_c19]|nr:MAG: hypothetical protein APF76_08165 [Desulfitibacter sp. BRH_c19]